MGLVTVSKKRKKKKKGGGGGTRDGWIGGSLSKCRELWNDK